MATWQIVSAVVSALIAGGLLWWRSSVLKDLAVMAATPTVRSADAARAAAGTLVEVKGKITSREPLIAEFSQQPCVWHRSTVEEEVEKPHNSDRSRARDTTKRTVHDNTRLVAAEIDDGSGPMAIDLNGATLEGVVAVKTFDREPGGGLSISFGGISLGNSVVGYHRHEELIPTGQQVYVLATSAGPGRPLSADPAGKNPFLVTVHSEEKRSSDNTSTARWLQGAAYAFFAAAAAFLVVPAFLG
jgi:E3 Ubiquitin ligase